MKRILTAVAALLFSVAMFAQSNDAPPPGGPQGGQPSRAGRPPMTPEQRAKRETEKINALTPLGDKYQKVLDLNTQTENKKEGITKGAKRSELTDDQRAQLKALNEEQRNQPDGGRPAPGGEGN